MNKVEKQLSMIIDLELWHMYPHMCKAHTCVHTWMHTHTKNEKKNSSPKPLAHTMRIDFEG